MTREEKLNNWMGLKHSGDTFQGEVIPSSDKVFKEFASPQAGVRAGTKVLLTYFNDYGLNTIEAIIRRWAPDSENNTQAYIEDVCQRVGVAAGDAVDLTDPIVMVNLVAAIVKHENGEVLDAEAISEGVQTAYA